MCNNTTKELATKYAQLKIQYEEIKEQMESIKEKLLDDLDFDRAELGELTVKRASRSTFSLKITEQDFEKKYPQCFKKQLDKKKLSKVWEVDKDAVYRVKTYTLQVDGVKKFLDDNL